MKQHLERLIALQEADLRLEEIAERKRRIPEMVEAARQPLLTAQATRDSLKQELDKLTKDRKTCEQDLAAQERSEEHTSELQSLAYLVCRLLLEKKKKQHHNRHDV